MKTRLQSWASPTTHFGNETAGKLSPAGLAGYGRAGRPCQKPGLTSSAPPHPGPGPGPALWVGPSQCLLCVGAAGEGAGPAEPGPQGQLGSGQQ